MCGPAEVLLSSGPEDAIRLARDATRRRADMVVAVGGDGTLNEVVNGMMQDAEAGSPRPILGVLALGTGRDFARSLGLSGDPREQLHRLAHGRNRTLDVGVVEYTDDRGAATTRFYANIASFGLSGATDRVMRRRTWRWLSSKLTFQLAVAEALWTYSDAAVRVSVDGERSAPETVKLVAVCNGRHFGGGMRIAPQAALDDGWLDVIVVAHVSVLTLARRFGSLYRGDHVRLPQVRTRRGRHVHAEPVDPLTRVPLDIDGEGIGWLPATFSVRAGALQVRC